jgi:hypothetical protein
MDGSDLLIAMRDSTPGLIKIVLTCKRRYLSRSFLVICVPFWCERPDLSPHKRIDLAHGSHGATVEFRAFAWPDIRVHILVRKRNKIPGSTGSFTIVVKPGSS